MKKMTTTVLDELLLRYPSLAVCSKAITLAIELVIRAYERDAVVFTCGNGGSAADADHIVGELLKGFVRRRPLPEADREALSREAGLDGDYLASRLQCGLRAMSLMSQQSLSSAVANDLGGDLGPAQQLYGMGRRGDVLIALSTSGNARNVALACHVAKIRGITIIGMTGMAGGRLAELADLCIKVPEKETYRVQELHLPVYHALCQAVETFFYDE
ncbi:MAG: D-sedoheptulose-7-phosphate isomerase [Lentisphaeria bacterium]|jgi:D-sedoheptulose 7-phosphate isomerase